MRRRQRQLLQHVPFQRPWLPAKLCVTNPAPPPPADYLNKRYPSPPLEPEDAAAAARARLFIELFGTHFTARMFGLFGTTNPEEVEEARAKLAAGIKVRALMAAVCGL